MSIFHSFFKKWICLFKRERKKKKAQCYYSLSSKISYCNSEIAEVCVIKLRPTRAWLLPGGLEKSPLTASQASQLPTQTQPTRLLVPLPALVSPPRQRGVWAGLSQGAGPAFTSCPSLPGSSRHRQTRQAAHHPHARGQVLHLQLEPGQLR